ncbi:MAG: Rieske (2Fe-2S) protein [Verrucomicrobiota bacterium]|nr:Rieske (2Fe-2S) protein [Verrucomicrobiota bacterium]MDP7049871.1 Rieske (2Fe-2S) protein [Verrucomicrobiota bacterium]
MENPEENQVKPSDAIVGESAGPVDIPESSQPRKSAKRSEPDSSFNYPIFGEASASADTQQEESGGPDDAVKQNENEEPVQERRGFIKFLCVLLGSLISLVPFGAGLRSYFDPLARRNKGGGGDGFVRVTSLDAIPADGTPAKFAVVADKVDAWNRFQNVSVGAVYLRLVNGEPEALHTVCPHLGCFVDYRPGNGDFFCPCHNSNFNLNGVRVKGVSPRAMDVLKIEVRNETEVWVKFQNFQPGHSHPVPV